MQIFRTGHRLVCHIRRNSGDISIPLPRHPHLPMGNVDIHPRTRKHKEHPANDNVFRWDFPDVNGFIYSMDLLSSPRAYVHFRAERPEESQAGH